VYALGRMRDTKVVPTLCEALRLEPGLWFAAVAALGEIGDARAIPDLSDLLAVLVPGREADLRQQIVVALGKIGDVSAVPALAGALDDPDLQVRASAVEALGKLGRVEAVPSLLQAFLDREPHVAGRAAAALGAIRDPRAVEPLARAVKALAAIGTTEVLPVLCRSLEDRNGTVRREAALGLAGIVRRGAAVPIQVRAAIPVLKELCGTFSQEPPEVKRACWDAIRRIETGTDSIKQLPLPTESAPLAPSMIGCNTGAIHWTGDCKTNSWRDQRSDPSGDNQPGVGLSGRHCSQRPG